MLGFQLQRQIESLVANFQVQGPSSLSLLVIFGQAIKSWPERKFIRLWMNLPVLRQTKIFVSLSRGKSRKLNQPSVLTCLLTMISGTTYLFQVMFLPINTDSAFQIMRHLNIFVILQLIRHSDLQTEISFGKYVRSN